MTTDQIEDLSCDIRFRIARKALGRAVTSSLMNEIQTEIVNCLKPIFIDQPHPSSIRINTLAKPETKSSYARQQYYLQYR